MADQFESDAAIARRNQLRHIHEVASGLGLGQEDLDLYGEHTAKIKKTSVDRILEGPGQQAPVVLVSAITPTAAGEGKSTCTVGLAQALNQIGKKAVPTLREPSMGPVFGRKGGATGGGYSQVLPMEDINLHFTGDMHAIAAANNLVAALLDNEFYFDNEQNISSQYVLWRRVLDINDRTLRNVVTGQSGNEANPLMSTGFDITAASTMMAILCLSQDYDELKQKIGRILLAFTQEAKPFTAGELGANGAAAALLRDALLPNLVQTSEHVPAFVHGGPFANIAQGTASVLSMRLARKLGDYVVTEAGFGFDLGGEKFMDLVGPYGGLMPSLVVLVATVRGLKLHGGAREDELNVPNVDAVWGGAGNLEKHVENVRKFGLEPVVAINRFPSDTENELAAARSICERAGVDASVVDYRAQGGVGGTELAEKVVSAVDRNGQHGHSLYDWRLDVEDKISTIATEVYGANEVHYTFAAHENLRVIREHGYDKLPICMAKTHQSLSDNPKLLGRPKDFSITVREIIISSGGGFLIPLTGKVLRMPGLPKRPAAFNIDIDNDGNIHGLF
jgi:formate--tetrahydrofolate ligase